jgi:subtilisin family serine protease
MTNRFLAVLAGLFAFSTVAVAQVGVVNKAAAVPVDPAVVRTALNEVIVQLAPGSDQAAFAKAYNLTLTYSYKSDANTFVFTSTDKIGTAMTAMAGDARVQSAQQNYQTVREKNAFTPDDPLYFPTGGFNGQWHLNNSLTPSRPHVNVVGAWNRDLTGQGVIIGIVDDGVEPDHVDMAANFNSTHTFDFLANQATQVFNNADRHGMSTSGVAAARGGNGIGVTGAAPFAQVASMKVFTGTTAGTDAEFADAVMYHSSGGNTSVTIKNHSYGIPTPFIDNTIESQAYSTSAAAGTVHVVSAGNDRASIGADANKKMAQANPDVITVAALGYNGVFSNYSNYGANITVTAPSNRTDVSAAGNSISTTDRTGNRGYNTNSSGSSNYSDRDYTNNFGGTSSSAPLVAGIMALGKQANPNMDVRLAKHILARTSTIVNASDSTSTSDGGWRTNAAGIHFNQNYGFGLVNADAFTQQITQFAVTPLTIATSGPVTVTGGAIPDNDATGISRTVVNSTAGKLEEIQVRLNITHEFRGDLQAFITNPSGNYTSRLFNNANDATNGTLDWTFTTNAFWGEDAQGTWTIRVVDTGGLDVGTWNSFDVTWRMGDITPVPEPGLTIAAVVLSGLLARPWRRARAGEHSLAA